MIRFKHHRDLSPAIVNTAEWLLNSGIQNLGAHKKKKGGVAAWYDIHKRQYPFLYSEITGYLLSTFTFLNRIDTHPIWLQRSRLAADWLLHNACDPSGGVRTRYYLTKEGEDPHYSFSEGRIYVFDTAIVGYGFIQLYKRSAQTRYLRFIKNVRRFLDSMSKNQKGEYYPYYESKSKSPGEDFGKWSDQSGTFHAKLSLFLIDYYRLSGSRRDKRAAVRLLDTTSSYQEPDGRFATSQGDQSTHLHPHCYTLEGLIYGAVFLKRRDYLEAAVRGMDWLCKAVCEDGFVSAGLHDESGFAHYERSDVVAQVLRLGSILHALKRSRQSNDIFLLRKLYRRLLKFQFSGSGPQKGGFLYGSEADGRLRLHLNAWASMFALQSLWMYEECVLRRQSLSLESFI